MSHFLWFTVYVYMDYEINELVLRLLLTKHFNCIYLLIYWLIFVIYLLIVCQIIQWLLKRMVVL